MYNKEEKPSIRFTKEIILNQDYEVIVVGGGPAGCAAAIAAARQGAKVLLLEESGSLGGMGTIGLVPAWCPFSDRQDIIYRGIAQEVLERAKAGMRHVKKEDADWVPIDSEALKRVYDRMVYEAGVSVLFHTQVISVSFSNRRIDHVVAVGRGGIFAFQGKNYIDCTGDADMSAMADLPYEFGDELTHEVQPATHCFVLSNVDEYHYMNSSLLHMSNPDCAAYTLARSEEYPLITDAHICHSLIGPRTVGFNAGHLWDIDPFDPFSESQALMKGRLLADQYHRGLKELLPDAYGSSFLTATASVLGTRETRRIVGDYKLTIQDYMKRQSFPDEVGRNCYFLDVHQTKEERDKIMNGENNGEEGWESYSAGESHGIPYRSLIVNHADNLLAAGRIISCDHRVQGSVRVMPVCLVTGQAAGTAAALALHYPDVRSIDIMELRNKLRESGAYFK
ncbi:hypothetical protein HNQ56_002893 [Anaerotaenia torta]|uniref:FAD-dependent oxidoreductase n=1 Tax=Anaerotaenia torta TaxID=433293 RepID=UPI003D2101B7